jgi:hypothetical protein
MYKLYFNKNKILIIPFFNKVPLLFSALIPSLHKLLYALRKKKPFLAELVATRAPLPSVIAPR